LNTAADRSQALEGTAEVWDLIRPVAVSLGERSFQGSPAGRILDEVARSINSARRPVAPRRGDRANGGPWELELLDDVGHHRCAGRASSTARLPGAR
jgi:hypothetical protein